MSKEIEMPTTPNFITSEFSLERTIGTTISPFTGSQRQQEFDNVFWSATVSLPPLNRSQASNWQSFLTRLKGPINNFQFTDPDAKTGTGTYNSNDLKANKRITNTNVTLSFSGNTITAGASTFSSAIVGDYIVVTGATNENNNGTHKITTVTSNTVVVVDTNLTAESSTASCKVQQNIKGSQGLSLLGDTNSATGTLAVGDYLGVLSGTLTTNQPIQLVLVTEVSTETSGTPNKYSVGIEPKLRQDIADNQLVKFNNAKGLFRLSENNANWSGNHNSIYNISFSCVEVI
tara:strand:- start:5514 stop:6380 length:867 start_codon:yes stop_codon:yes gene_type:complete